MHFLIFKPCKSIYVQIIFFIFLDSRLPQQNTNNFIHENTVEKRYEIVDELAQPTKNDKEQKREKSHVPSIYFETTEFKKDINNTYLNKQFDEMRQMNQMKPIHCTQSDNHYGYTTQQPMGQYFDVANGNNYQSMPQQTTQRQQFETNKFSQDDQFAQYRPKSKPRPQITSIVDQQKSSNLTGFIEPVNSSETPDIYQKPIKQEGKVFILTE